MNTFKASRAVLQHGKTVLTTPRRLRSWRPDSSNVHHDEKKKEFYLQLADDRAVIKYRKSDGILELYHTEVPKRLEGKGLAAILAKGTFNLIKEKKFRMKLSCDYLQYYVKKNKSEELQELLIPEQKNLF